MRILHISDFHLKAPFGQPVDNIFSRLYSFLAANAEETRFDHIVITGDIRDSKEGADCESIIRIIREIMVSTKIEQESLVHIIPGNHDLNRNVDDETVIGKIRDDYDFDRWIFARHTESLPLMLNRFDGFFMQLCDLFYDKSGNPWNKNQNPHVLYIDNRHAFISLNSCLTCINSKRDGELLIGIHYLQQLIEAINDAKNIFILSHHPLQNLSNREETELERLLLSIKEKNLYWLCGDAHNNRASGREYIKLLQVGSLTGSSKTIPDFAIYDIDDDNALKRRVFRFLPHLNGASANPGGWKRVYIDPKSPSIQYMEYE